MKSLNYPFDPESGMFANNIREEGDLSELRESMAAFGWNKEFPALSDEYGVILVGHRRLAVAKELGIEPVIRRLTLGDGDEADAQRLQLALVSNIGFKPMTLAERRRIAEYLYGEREWTMQRIAEALGVTHKTVSKDLSEFVPPVQIKASTGPANSEAAPKPQHAKTATNPKGAGRPKKNGPQPDRRKNPPASEQLAAQYVLDEGKSYKQAATEAGVDGSETVMKVAVAREEGRREAAGTVDPAILSMSAQQKLDTAIRQASKRLEVEIEQRVRAEMVQWIEARLKQHAEERDRFERVIKARRGVMSRADYKKILACLHPDRVTDPGLKARYEEAFILMTKLEKCLLDEKESPTDFAPIPRTVAELLAQKEKVKAERRAQREQNATVH